MAEIQRSYYAIIPANVRYDEDLTPNAKLLYGEITALCNERGYCWASNAYFAELYKVSKTSISKWIKQLVDKGYIHSQIEYKEGTKEILNRYLTIVNTPIKEKLNTPITKVVDPIKEKLGTPIKEKLKDNNTVFNNTVNTTSNNKDIDRQSSVMVHPYFDSIKQAFESAIRIATVQDCNHINEALDYYEPSLILKALEAGKNSARSFKYILSILDNWRKELGIKTYQDWQQKIQLKGGQFNASSRQSNGSNTSRTPEEMDMLAKLRNYSSTPRTN